MNSCRIAAWNRPPFSATLWGKNRHSVRLPVSPERWTAWSSSTSCPGSTGIQTRSSSTPCADSSTLGRPSTLREADGIMSPYIQDTAVRNLLKNLARNEKGYLEWRINLRAIVDNFGRMSEGVTGEPFEKPCLFIRGGLSDHIPDDRWDEVKEHFPRAKLLTIPDAGHWLHAERPQEFVNAVLDFLCS